MLIAVLISIAAVAAIQAVDVRHSERGFAKDYTEGNSYIRALFGSRPKTWQLYLVNTVTLALCALPAFWPNAGLRGLGLGLMTGLAARHIQAIYRW